MMTDACPVNTVGLEKIRRKEKSKTDITVFFPLGVFECYVRTNKLRAQIDRCSLSLSSQMCK